MWHKIISDFTPLGLDTYQKWKGVPNTSTVWRAGTQDRQWHWVFWTSLPGLCKLPGLLYSFTLLPRNSAALPSLVCPVHLCRGDCSAPLRSSYTLQTSNTDCGPFFDRAPITTLKKKILFIFSVLDTIFPVKSHKCINLQIWAESCVKL